MAASRIDPGRRRVTRPRVPKNRVLKPRHQRILAERGVGRALVDARGYTSADDDRALALVGWARGKRPSYVKPPALAIPVYSLTDLRLTDADEEFVPTYFQLRPDRPAIDPGSKKPRKYLNPIGQPAVVDVNPEGFDSEAFDDRELPLFIVEGIPKGDAGWTIGLPTVSIQGVWNFTSDDARAFRDFIPDLRYLPIEGREVVIAFDADAWSNPDVRAAARELARVLGRKAASVRALQLPNPEAKTGLDDFIASLSGADAEKRQAVFERVVDLDKLISPPSNEPLRLRSLADVEAKPIQYLWEPYVLRGTMGLLDGAPGTGKTWLALKLAASVTTGGTMPSAIRGKDRSAAEIPVTTKGNVLYFTGENSPAYSLRPRFDRLGGDASKLFILEHDADEPWTIREADRLRATIRATDAKLVVLDPLMNYVTHGDGRRDDADSHKDSDMRPILSKLLSVADETGATILGIRHLRKEATRIAVYAGGGSVAFSGTARFVLIAATWEKPGVGPKTVLAHAKVSEGPMGATLEYELTDAGRDVRGFFQTDLAFRDVADVDASALTDDSSRKGAKRTKRNVASDKLRDLLGTYDGAVPYEVIAAMAEELDVDVKTFRRAADELGVEKGTKTWHLPGKGEDGEKPRRRRVRKSLKGKKF